jgi:hypothetical protein
MDNINQLIEGRLISQVGDHYETRHGLDVTFNREDNYVHFCGIVYYSADFNNPTIIMKKPEFLYQDVVNMTAKLDAIIGNLPLHSTVFYNHNGCYNIIAFFHKNFIFRLFINNLKFMVLNDELAFYNDILFETENLNEIVEYLDKIVNNSIVNN